MRIQHPAQFVVKSRSPHACSRDALGHFLKEEIMENSTDSRTGRLQYIYSTLSIFLASVELVKLSEMLEKAYIPRRSEFGGFLHAHDPCGIPT